MPKASPLKSTFTGGEFSPIVQGRVDSDRYLTGANKVVNYVPLIQGPVTRRSGTRYVAEVKDSTKATRLIEFEFSVTQAYVIEVGHHYFRFCKNNAQILSVGVPYEISSTYDESDLFQLKFTQSADIIYITHPDYQSRKLSRTGDTAWTLTLLDLLDGPYLNTNTTSTTLTPSAATGTGVTLTASAVTGINGGAGFASTDVGRLIRIKEGSTWGYVKITAFTSTTVVTVTVVNTLTNTSAKAAWRLGVYSATTGYPATSTFHEDRLGFAGSPGSPQRIDLSNSGDYENFAPTANDGTIADTNAIGFTLNSSDVNVIRWIESDEKGLLAGTVSSEWAIRPSSQGEALTPTNVNAKQSTNIGSADIQPAKLSKGILFIQRFGRYAREMNYFYDVDGFRASDLTTLAPHIAGNSFVEISYQKSPYSILWAVREDGVLAGMSYERDLDALRVGWHRHIIGGFSDAEGTAAKVESVAVIPSPDASREEVWMIVQRYIDGQSVRYIEYMNKFFEDLDEQRDAYFVDCGLSYDQPKTITAITVGPDGMITVTSATHGFSNGNEILIDGVFGTTELNTNTYTVADVATNTFTLKDENGVYINGIDFDAYISGGEARKYITTISGLDHLEGETVSVCGDGAAQPDKVVASGAITLTTKSTTVHVGYGFQSDVQLLRLEAGAADGTALGKTRRTHRAAFYFYRSLGLKVGMDFDSLSPMIFSSISDILERATPLFSGIKSVEIEADYDTENQLCFRQDQPLPSTILAIMPQMHTEDR